MHALPLLLSATAVVMLSLAVSRLTPNQLVRRKMRLSSGLAAAYLVMHAILSLPPVQGLESQVGPFARLGLVLGVVIFIVSLLVNPLREDRVPEHFPNIVQDAMVIGLFMGGSVLVLGERVLATSAVSAVVLRFALQDTFGNMFAGLAIQTERPFSVGDVIGVGDHRGRVTQITWRATRLENTSGVAMVIPNNVVSKETIVNYSAPTLATRITIPMRVTYDVAPNLVRRAVLEALAADPEVMRVRPPDLLVEKFEDAVIVYHVRAWLTDIQKDSDLRDRVYTAAYYALKREHVDLPSPMPLMVHTAHVVDHGAQRAAVAALLDTVDILMPLSEDQRHRLAALVTDRTYGDGEAIVLEGHEGHSMFIVAGGQVRVLIEPGAHEIAQLSTGEYFGEMSLLTGTPRAATIRAVGDSRLLEISTETFKWLIGDHPEVLAAISHVVALRHVELARRKDAASVPVEPEEEERSLFARISAFFGVGGAGPA